MRRMCAVIFCVFLSAACTRGGTPSTPAVPARLVSLAPSLTEIVYALGTADRLVGVCAYCDFPAEAKAKLRVGGPTSPDLERIVALAPDLVLLAGTHGDMADQLADLGIACFQDQAADLPGVVRTVRALGARLDRGREADQLAGRMEERMRTIAAALAGAGAVDALLLVGRSPMVAAGTGTFPGDLLVRAGGRNLADRLTGAWPRLGDEDLLDLRPAVVLDASQEGGGPPILDAGARWITVDADLVARPGHRLVDGLEQLARLLHPESFR